MLTNVATERAKFSANEESIIWYDRQGRHKQRPLVLFCHTTGVTTKGINHPAFGQWQVPERIASWGFCVVAGDLGVDQAAAPNDGRNTWGNAVARARIETIRVAMMASGMCLNAPIIIIGASMGGLNAFNYTVNNAANVRGLVTIMGVAALNTTYQANRGSAGSLIAGAHGVVFNAALPAGVDPILIYAPIVHKPFLAFYATDDTAVLPSETIALEAVMGKNSQLVSLGALGHTEAAIAATASRPELLDFIANLL